MRYLFSLSFFLAMITPLLFGCGLSQHKTSNPRAQLADEIGAIVAVQAAYVTTIESDSIPDVPDTPDNQEICPSCSNTGCVGDGTIFLSCQECNRTCPRELAELKARVAQLEAEKAEWKVKETKWIAYGERMSAYCRSQGLSIEGDEQSTVEDRAVCVGTTHISLPEKSYTRRVRLFRH